MQSHGTMSHRLVGNMRSGPEHRACAPPLATPSARQRAGTVCTLSIAGGQYRPSHDESRKPCGHHRRAPPLAVSLPSTPSTSQLPVVKRRKLNCGAWWGGAPQSPGTFDVSSNTLGKCTNSNQMRSLLQGLGTPTRLATAKEAQRRAARIPSSHESPHATQPERFLLQVCAKSLGGPRQWSKILLLEWIVLHFA